MPFATRAALLDVAAALLAGADAPAPDAAKPGLQLISPAPGEELLGEPVRRDRRAPGQGSFHLVAESAERARLMRAEAAALAQALRLGWKAVALGGPAEAPDAAAARDLSVAVEEGPSALVSLGWFPMDDGGGAADALDAAYIGAAATVATRQGARVWALSAHRAPGGTLQAAACAPGAALSRFSSPSKGAPIAFRAVILG